MNVNNGNEKKDSSQVEAYYMFQPFHNHAHEIKKITV